MTDDDQSPPQVGSVAEEAAALLSALSGFAREQGSQYAGAAAGAADAAAHALRDANEHIATGSKECTWCPICQVVHVVRTTSPEVKAQLAIAANALVQAAASALSTHVPADAKPSVERIDLDGDDDGDGWEDQ